MTTQHVMALSDDSPRPMPKARVREDDEANFGIELNRVPDGPTYRVNGQSVSRELALAAVGNTVPDDRDRLRLTIVGDAKWRQRVVDDWEKNSAFAELRERVLVQAYPPDHWAVLDVGLPAGITLQLPARADGTGPVLFRSTEYVGPEWLAGAIRKADPKYQPERDPDPARPPATPLAPAVPTPPTNPAVEPPRGTLVPPEAWYCLAGLALAWAAQRFKLPWPSTRRADDIRPQVREVLAELMQPPADDPLRQRLSELARAGPGRG